VSENTLLNDDDAGIVSDESGDDLFKQVNLDVDKGQTPLRIDKFLHNHIGNNVSRNKIQNAARAGSIIVNGIPVKPNYKIRPLDKIQLILPQHEENFDLVPENIPLDVVYEDDDLLIINKQPNLVVHPGLGNHRGTLINALMYHFTNLPTGSAENRPGLVHRLDKDTSGLMVIAKTEYAMTHLAKQFFDRAIKRKYVALVWGNLVDDEGTIVANIGRDSRDRMQMSVYQDGEGGKHAITHYKVLERLNYVTKVECRLETGRTHQIRVHMKHIGHTLFNDKRYGGDRILKGTIYSKYKQFIDNCFDILPRQALHAATLGFIHPTKGTEMFFESNLPSEFELLLSKWRKYWSSSTHEVEE
jgi:23S rRNA pseudouridine1911/1915/1917 synthase